MSEVFQPLISMFPYLLGLLVVAIFFKLMKKLLEEKSASTLPYEKTPSIMTTAEQKYFRQLEQQYAQKYYVFPQVKLDKLVKTTNQKNFYTYWNKINKKSIDFVLVDKSTLETVQLIELNDYTHKQSRRADRDIFIKRVCDKAGIDLKMVS